MQQPRSSGPGLTDTLWATVTPFGCSGISAMAGDLARTLELVALVTWETDHRSNSEACFGAHWACSVHNLPRVRTLLDCGKEIKTHRLHSTSILNSIFKVGSVNSISILGMVWTHCKIYQEGHICFKNQVFHFCSCSSLFLSIFKSI